MPAVGDLPPGLYEALVTEGLAARLAGLRPDLVAADGLHAAEAADRIAWHLARQVERAVAGMGEDTRVALGIGVARALLERLGELATADADDLPAEPGRVLHAVHGRNPAGEPDHVVVPLIPLLDTTLLTNAPGEPSLWSQLQSEIASAEAIDVVMAFIRRSGIAPLLAALRRHCDAGRPLRVLTTTYTGSTEQAALEQLRELGADVRVSYDRSTTRLHAKAWVFHRPTGVSTAYVGSSNLTHSAQVTGLEWNVRVSAARNPDVVAKFAAVFDGYWSGGDFTPFDAERFRADARAAGHADTGPRVMLSPVEVRPRPFQERLLELLAVSRRRGHHRNLLAAATGTGKTVMAALDYARLRADLPRARLLFVAHRQEILDQSQATFRHVLRDAAFGERWVDGDRPDRFEHVFASIQSMSRADPGALDPRHFDVVIVDEFHHAAAATYTRLLDHLRPAELLGLTATPERADGLDVLHWFDDRIAAELRLWDAVDQQHLVPFMYFGVADGTDLTGIPWRRGHGYDDTALERVYTSDDAWARLVVRAVRDHAEPTTMRCLGFCVGVGHAEFMARHFTRHGIPSVAVSGTTRTAERQDALDRLRTGEIRAVFSVDIFTEGVDVPAVDTILMLRPTESPVLFLQQLGRGLRKADGKPFCTVLDMVGNHRTEFRFDRRLRALLGGTRLDVKRQVLDGFPYLPAGCHMELDPVAQQRVLRSLQQAIPTGWSQKVDELRSLLRATERDIGLAEFLRDSGLDPEDVYAGDRSWSDLRQAAGASVLPAGPHEAALRRAVGRMLHVDDGERIDGWRHLLSAPAAPRVHALPERQRRLLLMLPAALTTDGGLLPKGRSAQDAVDLLWAHPQVRAELAEVLGVLDTRVDHLHTPLVSRPDVPLQVHARYTRREILAATGEAEGGHIPAWREGVRHAKDARADLLAFTLDKTGAGFSPTTRYRDYAVSRTLIHWESQSTTRADSPTGIRYRTHEDDGHAILLFARLHPDDRAFWFLGPATYRGHTGDRPMAVTWELAHPLPGDLYAAFAAAVA